MDYSYKSHSKTIYQWFKVHSTYIFVTLFIGVYWEKYSVLLVQISASFRQENITLDVTEMSTIDNAFWRVLDMGLSNF